MEILGWLFSVVGVILLLMAVFARVDTLWSHARADLDRDDPAFGHYARATKRHPRASYFMSGAVLLAFGLHFLKVIQNPIYLVLRLIDKIFSSV